MDRKYKGVERMVERVIDREIMDIVNKYVQVILANYKVKAIILFGSYAKGTNHEDSDIDIAIITDDIKCNDVFDEQLNLKKLMKSHNHFIIVRFCCITELNDI